MIQLYRCLLTVEKWGLYPEVYTLNYTLRLDFCSQFAERFIGRGALSPPHPSLRSSKHGLLLFKLMTETRSFPDLTCFFSNGAGPVCQNLNGFIITMNIYVRVRLALKPRFLSKGLASQSVRICVFVAYRVSGHSTQDN